MNHQQHPYLVPNSHYQHSGLKYPPSSSSSSSPSPDSPEHHQHHHQLPQYPQISAPQSQDYHQRGSDRNRHQGQTNPHGSFPDAGYHDPAYHPGVTPVSSPVSPSGGGGGAYDYANFLSATPTSGNGTDPAFFPTPSQLRNYHGVDSTGSYPTHDVYLRSTQQSHASSLYSSQHQQHTLQPIQTQPELMRPSSSRDGATTSPSGSSPSPSSAQQQGDRFLCEQCGRSFTRAHDRKRHFETHHLANPTLHRCRNCDKSFSRSDSLKRHINNNGCPDI